MTQRDILDDMLYVTVKTLISNNPTYGKKHYVATFDTLLEAEVGAEELFDVLTKISDQNPIYKFFEIHSKKEKHTRKLYVRFVEPAAFETKLMKKIRNTINTFSILKPKYVSFKIDSCMPEIYNDCYLRNINIVLNPYKIVVTRLAWTYDGIVDVDSYCFRSENSVKDVKQKLSAYDLKHNKKVAV
jgi:hypothetical protein